MLLGNERCRRAYRGHARTLDEARQASRMSLGAGGMLPPSDAMWIALPRLAEKSTVASVRLGVIVAPAIGRGYGTGGLWCPRRQATKEEADGERSGDSASRHSPPDGERLTSATGGGVPISPRANGARLSPIPPPHLICLDGREFRRAGTLSDDQPSAASACQSAFPPLSARDGR